MKNYLVIIFLLLFSSFMNAADKDSTVNYNLPDSVKIVQFTAEINIKAITGKKEVFAGIKTDIVQLSLESDKNEKEIVFEFPATAKIVATGQYVDTAEKGEIEFTYNWSINETYKLLIAQATDSAGNFSLYSSYVFLPKENKWKLIGTCKINGRWNTIQNPATFFSANRKAGLQTSFGQVWCQRTNGSWKNMKEETSPVPVINLFDHVDSIRQREIDVKLIINKPVGSETEIKALSTGIFYKMIKEGTGRQVSINDTVIVFYKGYLFANDSVFDQTKDKPATFPLKRLIKGWQIGLSLCKVGGKIKLIIPSDLAYSIRTRSAKIPPNSILVFEIEVVDAKSPL